MTDLLELAGDLYGLPLAEFTPARDARARELKGTALAEQVKRLRKPTTAAWVVDLLVRFETEQVDQILAVGAALRAAQESLDAAQLRELTRQRRQLTAAMTGRARALARERGLKVTDAVAEQVETTLTAAMIDEGAARAVRSGLLVAPLSATGFEAVDAASAVALPEALGFEAPAARRELHAVQQAEETGPDQVARDAAETALAEARAGLEETRREHDETVERAERLRARALEVESQLEELRRRLAELEDQAEASADELAAAEDDQDAAAAAVTEAQERVAAAEERLRDL